MRKKVDAAAKWAKVWEGRARVALVYVVAGMLAACTYSKLRAGVPVSSAVAPCCEKFVGALLGSSAKAESLLPAPAGSGMFKMDETGRILGWSTNGGATWLTHAPAKGTNDGT